jgi:hypothetical protein
MSIEKKIKQVLGKKYDFALAGWLINSQIRGEELPDSREKHVYHLVFPLIILQ